MRTLTLIVIGLLLAAGLLRLAPAAYRTVTVVAFTILWLGVCGWNLQLGLSHGYTMAEELPIHLALFGLPAAFIWSVWWRQRGQNE
ncbi:MAG: hypothetical protein U0998_03565 [Moraxellaceae bacterium]|nr:hypothetical protein [Moraxellaceae bacterium]MDZ4386282.1 hypothetical protein [Moraxellaceae bacterium]